MKQFYSSMTMGAVLEKRFQVFPADILPSYNYFVEYATYGMSECEYQSENNPNFLYFLADPQ